jgi:uncharacterized sulfatase
MGHATFSLDEEHPMPRPMTRPPCCAALGLALACLTPLPAAERPNLVAIVTDDQARWGVGLYGNPEVRTPNMDRIGREGAVFLNAFVVTPVCSPSRAAYMTGRYGTQLGITDWINPQEGSAGVGLPADAVTWPAVLQRHGYVTGLFGKWHLGDRPTNHPTRLGFSRFMGGLGGGFSPMNPTLEVDGKLTELHGPASDLITDAALRFLDGTQGRPFACLLHFREPHLPYGPMPEQDQAVYQGLDPKIPQFRGLDERQVKDWTRGYYTAIHAADRNIGRVLARLDELGVAKNTVVLFTSDHGYNIGHHGVHTKGNAHWVVGGVQGPKRPNMWDTSIRVPLLVRWPGVVRPGTRVERVVSHLDVFPTALAMTGVPMPAGYVQHGRDFTPLLRGGQPTWDDTLFGQYDLHNAGLAYMRMVRTPEWKLIRHFRCSGLDELYDLKNDPEETKNLYSSGKSEPVRRQLEERMFTWMKSIDDPLLKPAPGVPALLGPLPPK